MCCLSPQLGHADDAQVKTLLAGVNQIASPGVPGNICVFGEDSFAVVQDAGNNTVVAATHFAKGRVVLWGHNGYFGKKTLETADTGRLLVNAIRWAAQGKSRPRVGFVGRGDAVEYLQAAGLQCERIGVKDYPKVDVLVGSVERASADLLAGLSDWVRAGGGLISSATGWGWSQIHRGKDIRTDFQDNRLLAPMGLIFAKGTTQDTAGDGFNTTTAPTPLLNASHALDAVLQHVDRKQTLSDDQLATAGAVLSLAMRSLPADDKVFLPRLDRALSKKKIDPRPTRRNPITEKQVLERLVLTEQIRRLQELPADEVTAHRSAADFPGVSSKRMRRATRSVEINSTLPGWHSTGLYADPGVPITVQLPPSTAKKGWKVRLGSTTCRLWAKSRWTRSPEITREFTVTQSRIEAASAFGGLIYIVVPEGGRLGDVSITIDGGVQAPYFVLGETSLRDWQRRIRSLPAPWAELASTKAILTVPSSAIRKLDDPERLLTTWNDILDAAADLAQKPRERKRPQRYVADIQLCAGYMHAGNPIMVPLSTAGQLVDRNHLLQKGDWGFYHETGHMHQHKDWTFSGTGEVTVNLFTMFIFDKVCGIPPEKGRMAQDKIKKQYLAYFQKGCKFDEWKSNPFLALYMYYQLQQQFGWDAFKQVFAEYRDLPDAARPKSDDEKRDQWMVRFSRAVDRNLGPFFEAWGVPTSSQARGAIQDLPPWMPKDFPPQAKRRS